MLKHCRPDILARGHLSLLHRDYWDDLLPTIIIIYCSSVHESTGFSPYRLMFGEECPASLAPHMSIRIADSHVLHPLFHHRLDVGPLRLTSIAHAFNYRIAVLRDGVKLAARVSRSRRAARQILENADIP